MARIAPSRPTTKRPWPRPTTAPGTPWAISSGTSSEAARTSVSGAMRNVRSARAAPRRVGQRERVRGRVDDRADHRSPDPEAGDRGVAPGLGRVVDERAGGPRLGQVGGDLRVVGGRPRAAAEVGPGRVGEVGEGECPPDDRDRVARLEAGLAVRPPAAAVAERRRSADHSGAWTRSSAAIGRGPVDLGRSRRPAPADGEPGRLVAERPGLALEADRGVEPRAARKDPEAPRRVADAEPDRPFLRVPGIRAASLAGRRRPSRGSRRTGRSGAGRRGSARPARRCRSRAPRRPPATRWSMWTCRRRGRATDSRRDRVRAG